MRRLWSSEPVTALCKGLSMMVASCACSMVIATAQCTSSVASLEMNGVLTQIAVLRSGGGFSAGWITSQQGDKDVIVFRQQLPNLYEWPCGLCPLPSGCRRCLIPWSIIVPLPGSDEIPVAILASNEEEAVIVAQELRGGQPTGIVTLKVTVSNNQLNLAWRRQVGLPGMQFRDAALLSNGDILIATSYRGATGKDWFLIRYASNGLVQDYRPIDGGYGDDEPTSIAVNAAGVFVGGYLTRESGTTEGVIYAYFPGGYYVFRNTHPDNSYIAKLIVDRPDDVEFVGIGAKRGSLGYDPFVVTYLPTAGAIEEDYGWVRQMAGMSTYPADYYPADIATIPIPNTSRRHLLLAVREVPLIGTQTRPQPRILIAQQRWRQLPNGIWKALLDVHDLEGLPSSAVPVDLQLVARGSLGYDWALFCVLPVREYPSYTGRAFVFGSWNPDGAGVVARRYNYSGYFVYSLPPIAFPGINAWKYRGGYFVYRIPEDPNDPASTGQAILYGTRTPTNPRIESLFVQSPSRADVNGDCCVDDQDLLAVLFAFGSSSPTEDTNLDGIVDDQDLLSVLFSFGRCP